MNLCNELKIAIIEGKDLDSKYTSNDNAMAMIRDEINQMEFEIEQSDKGTRNNIEDPNDYKKRIIFKNASTFPLYLQDIFNGAGTKKKFLKATKMGKGIVWKRIALLAIDRLEHGYKNPHGYDEPNQDFIKEVEDPTPF